MSEKIKVSELTESTTTNDDDLIMIVQENGDNELENFKQTRANFLDGINLSNYYTKEEIDEMIGDIETLLYNINRGSGV